MCIQFVIFHLFIIFLRIFLCFRHCFYYHVQVFFYISHYFIIKCKLIRIIFFFLSCIVIHVFFNVLLIALYHDVQIFSICIFISFYYVFMSGRTYFNCRFFFFSSRFVTFHVFKTLKLIFPIAHHYIQVFSI